MMAKKIKETYTPYVVECIALREGIIFTRNFSLPVNSVESDSLHAIQAIKHSLLQESVGPILQDIRELLVSGSGGTSCNHISRDGNKVAHLLVKFRFSSRVNINSCDVIPLFIRDVVVSDLAVVVS